jgi:hypothetical protein
MEDNPELSRRWLLKGAAAVGRCLVDGKFGPQQGRARATESCERFDEVSGQAERRQAVQQLRAIHSQQQLQGG